MGIPFGLFKFEQITIFQLTSAIGAFIGFYLFYHRNRIFEKQLIQKDIQYSKDAQFKNFLEATKMLTDKDSTVDAKISSLYLLYDVAKSHPENIDRIIQVINKQLTPLFNCIENNCNSKKYTKKLSSVEMNYYPKRKKQIYEYTNNENINIDLSLPEAQRTIKEWKYKGNDTEKLISIALHILKRIILKILPKVKYHVDLSHTIIFDIDTDFDTDLKFISIERPTENLVFLCCKLHKVSFKNTIYHQASFIDCMLEKSNFSKANLWGALFERCDLKNVKFDKAECEAVQFTKCTFFTIKQIEKMKFKNKNENEKIKYPIILSEEIDVIAKGTYFKTLKEFNKWRYND